MATAIQTAINKAAGVSGKSERERERRLRLVHEKKSRGPAGSVREEAPPPNTEQD